MKQKLTMFLICLLSVSNLINAQKISGELKKWHKVTLSVDLPSANLNESANTFKNHRMDVVFTDPNGGKIRVPGYFAADGNAANSSSKSGKNFKAILRPYMTGAWKYEVLYYTGTDVALKNVTQLPAPAKRLTGNVGTIQNNNKSVPDLRAKGRLTYKTSGNNNSRRYLQFAETGEYFLKIGPDSPENFLNYNEFDFDAKLNKCGLCPTHKFAPHKGEFKNGDPTFKNGKGKNIIGALNYIKRQGMNSFSMSLYGGDDKNVFPWVNLNNKFAFDVSKLDQWEVVFDHAEKLGLAMHFKLAENENWDKLNANEIRAQYREMVARFGHHLAIEWNISEEYRGAAQSAMARIDFLATIDAYQNHRVIHTYPGEHSKYNDWLRLGAKLTGASIQSSRNQNYRDAYNGKSGILTWINNSKNNNTPWVVASDEQNSGKTGIFTDEKMSTKSVVKEARTIILWKTLIAGGQGVMWYGGSRGDFQTENFDRFSTLFNWSRHAFNFFKGNKIPYWNMANNDKLANGNNNHVLAEVGKTYVIYLENGGNTQLNLSGVNGNFNVKWFDPRNGGTLKNGSVTQISGGAKRGIGNPPNNTNNDWVALVTNTNNTVTNPAPPVVVGPVADPSPNPSVTPPTNGNCNEKIFEENNGVIAVEAEDFISQSKTSKREWLVLDKNTKNTPKPDPDGNHADGASNGKYIELLPDTRVVHADPLENGVSFSNTPGEAAIVNYKVNFKSAGKYFVWVRAYSTGTEDNGVHVGLDGKWPASGARMQWCSGKNNWTWESKQRTAANHCGEPEKIFLNVTSAGVHTVSFSMREDGFEIDKFILSKAYKKPSGQGTKAIAENCTNNPAPAPTPTPTPTTPKPAPQNPTNGNCSNSSLNAINDFNKLNVNGFSPAYKDNARKAIAINAAQHKNKFAAAETNFKGETGTYNIKLNTLAELDGESTYRLRVGGKLIGTYKNPETTTDYSPAGKTFNNVSVKKGDIIRVESSSHTNGKIPENGGTAFSRGRWTGIQFTCVAANPTPEPTTPNPEPTPKPTTPTPTTNGDVIIYEHCNFGGESLALNVGNYSNFNNLKFSNDQLSSIKIASGYTVQLFANSNFNGKSITLKANNACLIGDNFNDIVSSIKVSKTNEAKPVTKTFNAYQDAFMQGSTSFNTEILRTENRKRTTYLKFDLRSVKGAIKNANLALIVDGDAGNGTIEVYQGVDKGWTELNLNKNNEPTNIKKLGSVSGNFALGKKIDIKLANIDKKNYVTFIIRQTSGNDVAFASKENGNKGPKLTLTYANNNGAKIGAEDLNITAKVYPNPTANTVTVNSENLSLLESINVYDLSGTLLETVNIDKETTETSIDLSAYSKGIYLLSLQGAGNKLKIVKVIKE
ncbi:CBM96 family carbohydrate-binding protein [Aquimarina agarilytica]|uniref:CBM96 family carbohydrate-binding protein n=1 Tax=Aquimarina agarilytica TaxID=1087449 RepID=UPI0012F8547F|nr:T9SS type A sorting domain-containing protein [Aquimarina agarilytica]